MMLTKASRFNSRSLSADAMPVTEALGTLSESGHLADLSAAASHKKMRFAMVNLAKLNRIGARRKEAWLT